MNELLENWKSRTGALIANIVDLPYIDEPIKPTRRRLTATISRSVEIQTESEAKILQEKGISTEGNFHVFLFVCFTLPLFTVSFF